jgi:hypothetical protein
MTDEPKSSNDSTERYYAEMEAARHESEEAYFNARPSLWNECDRALFRSGFEHAFKLLWDRQHASETSHEKPGLAPEPAYKVDSQGEVWVRVPEQAFAGKRAPLSELQEALASEGEKDYRIEALEAALDWAIHAVFTHYTEGEAPVVPGAYEEIEKSRARYLAECQRLAGGRQVQEKEPDTVQR